MSVPDPCWLSELYSINICRPQEPDQWVILTLTNPQPLRLGFQYGLGTDEVDYHESHTDIHVPLECNNFGDPSITPTHFDFVQLISSSPNTH